jgi:hypothetical protein
MKTTTYVCACCGITVTGKPDLALGCMSCGMTLCPIADLADVLAQLRQDGIRWALKRQG